MIYVVTPIHKVIYDLAKRVIDDSAIPSTKENITELIADNLQITIDQAEELVAGDLEITSEMIHRAFFHFANNEKPIIMEISKDLVK